MWRKVYYKNFIYCSKEWINEDKVLPYMVLEYDKEKREDFKKYLEQKGYECCAWNDYYPGVLVNTQFKRFALIHRPCTFSHIGDRNYSIDEFISNIL